jgi:hypothetical protein
MRENPIVFFVEGATDPIDDFGAKGVRHVPLATGPEDCDTRVSCFHLAAGARIAEIPTCQDSAFLVVQGRLTADWCGGNIEMSGGMGVVLDAGHAVRVWSDDGAVVILVEAPRLIATRRGISTPDRIMWQGWPGERPPGKTLMRVVQSIRLRMRWWRLRLPQVPCDRSEMIFQLYARLISTKSKWVPRIAIRRKARD